MNHACTGSPSRTLRFALGLGALLLAAIWAALPAAASAATAGDAAGTAPVAAGEAAAKAPDQTSRFELGDQQFSVRLSAFIQARFTYEMPDDGEDRGSFRVRRAKVKLTGKLFGDWGYQLQSVLNGSSVLLDDAWLEHTRHPLFRIRVGQGKTPFGRQFLTSGSKQQFVERSIASDRFAHGRDIGLWILGDSPARRFEYNLGVFNGNGVNQKKDDNDELLYTARFVVTPFGAYRPEESAHDYPARPVLALGVSGLVTTQGQGDAAVDLTRLGGELAFKVKGLNAVAEYYRETAEPATGGSRDADGLYAQLGLLFPNRKLEIAGRYSLISPDVSGPSQDETETGIAVSYYLHKHNYKLQADVRSLGFDAAPEEDRDEVRLQLQLMF